MASSNQKPSESEQPKEKVPKVSEKVNVVNSPIKKQLRVKKSETMPGTSQLVRDVLNIAYQPGFGLDQARVKTSNKGLQKLSRNGSLFGKIR